MDCVTSFMKFSTIWSSWVVFEILKCKYIYTEEGRLIKMSLTFSLEFRTMAWVWGILTIWCWLFLPKGSHTRAGRFKLSIANSAINLDAINIVNHIIPKYFVITQEMILANCSNFWGNSQCKIKHHKW